MKLKYWLIVALLCSFGSTLAQGGKLQLGLGGGASIPVGAFTKYTAPSLGFATLGGGGKIDASYSFHPLFAAYITGYYGLNPIQADSLAKAIWEENKGAAKITVDAMPYTSGAALAGVKFHSPRGKKISFSAGISVGMMVTTTPEIYREIALASPIHQQILPATGTAFCLNPQVEVQLHLIGPLSLALYGEYMQSSPTFTFVTHPDTDPDPVDVEAKQNIQMVNAGVKIVISLLKVRAI